MPESKVKNATGRPFPLRWVLSLALVLIVLLPAIPLGLSVWLGYRQDVRELSSQLQDTNRQVARLSANLCEQTLRATTSAESLAGDCHARRSCPDPEFLRESLALKLDSPHRRTLTIVDRTGRLIFHSDPGFSVSAGEPLDTPPVRYFLNGGRGEYQNNSLDSGPRGMAYVQIMPTTGWAVIVEVNIAEEMLGFSGRLIWLVAAILFSGMLAIGVVAVFSRMVILPLVSLSRDIRRRDRRPTDSLRLSGSGQKILEFRQLVAEFNAHSEERRRAEQQTVQAEKLATLGEMAAGLAHEIGTPLNVMRGNAQLIQRRLPQEDPNRAVLDKIIQQTTRIADLIRGLLDLSRADQDEFAPVGLGGIASRSVETIRSLYPEIKVALNVDEPEPTLRGRARPIEHAMLNLMVNSCQAMDGKGDLEVTIRLSPLSDERLVSVRDTGCGISPEDLPRIFQPFFSTKASGKGTGLGLALVDRVMREHGGSVRVFSTPGEGSLFELCFPSGEVRSSDGA